MTYQENLATERDGMQTIIDYLTHRTGRQPIPITDKNQQKLIGDLIVTTGQATTSLEVKIEERFTGNLFIEVWSNREWGTPGWLFTSQANLIVFYFRDADKFFRMSLQSLKHWLLNQQDGQLDKYQQIRVKQSGRNDTYGICVPISDLRAAQLKCWRESSPKKELEQHACA